MPLLSGLTSAWRTLFRRTRLDADLDDELRGYLDLLVDRKVRAGMDPAEARRTALVEMGGLVQVRDDVRGSRIGVGLETTLQDVRYAWRDSAALARLRSGHHPDARARHRRQHGDLQRRARNAPGAAAVPRLVAARVRGRT